MTTEERMRKMMDVVEEYTPEEGRIKIHYLLNDGHDDEYSANAKISHMRPVAWIGATSTPKDMHEYISILGLTPALAKQMVYEALDTARSKASSIGASAPSLKANEWDCYWCMAMMIADYWVTHWGDLDVAAMLAYQYLSDPDRI